MDTLATQQAYSFLIFLLNGTIIGILFDIFRILRKSFQTADIVTYIEDFLFWILSGIITLFMIFKFNSGELRFYIFIGIILGVGLYLLTLSKYFIKINVLLISIIKLITEKILSTVFYPIKILLKLLRKIFLRPISFIIINFKKINNKLRNYCKKTITNIKKNKNKQRNPVQKKDFNI